MRATTLAVLAAAAAGLSGCVVHARGTHHRVAVVHDHHYVYYPSHHAYHCTMHDHWFVRDSGSWVQLSARPPSIHISAEIPFVEVEVDGPHPYVRYEEHRRHYPDDWHPGRGKGPPPGRGWRK